MTPASHRDQLVAMLCEAAEIEHCLMCTYLYAAFSLKQNDDEGLTPDELIAVSNWRKEIIRIATDEMLHLALVNNLLIAIGGKPHYRRFNFPIGTGLFPADVAVALAPLNEQTLDHFIYLERPADVTERDANSYEKADYKRTALPDKLMDANDDYTTVGELYETIERSFEQLCSSVGESNFLVGLAADQLCDKDTYLPGLCTITCLADVRQAIEFIIHQGEGSKGENEQSHYARFCGIRDEWHLLRQARAEFVPYRPAAANPVMRTPVVTQERIQIVMEPALSLLDIGNTSYVTMLRLLAIMCNSSKCLLSRNQIMRQSLNLMHVIADIGLTLTRLPANPDYPEVTAGLTFTVSRADLSYQSGESAASLLAERLGQIAHACEQQAAHLPALSRVAAQLLKDAADWHSVAPQKEDSNGAIVNPTSTKSDLAVSVSEGASELDASRIVTKHATSDVPQHDAANSDVSENNRADTSELTLIFDAKRCIHARHCVVGEPEVFLANTPGKWLYPEKATPERIAIVAHNCPSGAIRYERKDGQPGEQTPPVNMLRVRENGPLAVHADMQLEQPDGVQRQEFRATLCRCGQSQNKPYCDGSHANAEFVASGEPPTQVSQPLSNRGGELQITPLRDGPLEMTGALELCTGTGRIIDRLMATRLCRCGQSKNKPFCDSSHLAAGFVATGV